MSEDQGFNKLSVCLSVCLMMSDDACFKGGGFWLANDSGGRDYANSVSLLESHWIRSPPDQLSKSAASSVSSCAPAIHTHTHPYTPTHSGFADKNPSPVRGSGPGLWIRTTILPVNITKLAKGGGWTLWVGGCVCVASVMRSAQNCVCASAKWLKCVSVFVCARYDVFTRISHHWCRQIKWVDMTDKMS